MSRPNASEAQRDRAKERDGEREERDRESGHRSLRLSMLTAALDPGRRQHRKGQKLRLKMFGRFIVVVVEPFAML